MPHSLLISGKFAFFPDAAKATDQVTYEVIPPIAARAIFEAIHWTPAIRWQIEQIDVLRPILRQRVSVGAGVEVDALLDVEYAVYARFEMTDRAGPRDNAPQHANIFRSRARRQQFFRTPYLGLPCLPASIRLLEKGERPTRDQQASDNKDLGLMPHDRDFSRDHRLRYYHAHMVDGTIDLRNVETFATVG